MKLELEVVVVGRRGWRRIEKVGRQRGVKDKMVMMEKTMGFRARYSVSFGKIQNN